MEEDKVNINMRFEAGMSDEEIINNIRERLKGKLSDETIEEFVNSYINTHTIVCDSCDSYISSRTKIYNCRYCNLNYDLCDKCQKNDNSICPEGFGCFRSDNPENKYFMRSDNKSNKGDTYDIFNHTYKRAAKTMPPDDEIRQKLLSYIEKCNEMKNVGAIYIPEKNVSLCLFEDMWLYFRSTNKTSLDKYGPPNTKLNTLGLQRLIQLYEQLEPLFLEFIKLDENIDNTILFNIVAPNGNIIIRKVMTDEKYDCPFLINTLYHNNNNILSNETFRKIIEQFINVETWNTVDELNENGDFYIVFISQNS